MHPVPRRRTRTRAGSALAHLLLVGVLALGVFVMHTVGHPKDAMPGGMADGTTMTAAVPAPAPAPAHDGTAPASAHGSPHASPVHDPGSHSGSGMDMTTLCVAVLGAWLLAALLRAVLARRHGRGTAPLARRRTVRVPHAPPPRPPDLAVLSVLRT
ncbi:DUF6153 family protein [Streptomyces laurentii]|uniref:DUF6153 family protein n=1 Tax=Streptomyces laurentii TaxID=39478 RepID=UPI00340D30BC